MMQTPLKYTELELIRTYYQPYSGWGMLLLSLLLYLFLLYLLSSYHQTRHDSTMAQNPSKEVKIKSIMMSP